LAPIQNGLFLLRKNVGADRQALRTLTILDRQVGHLTRLIDDLLDLTRISRGKIKLQKSCLDLGELVRQTAGDYRSTLTEKGIRLEVDQTGGSFPVIGDATRLAQVIGNLLSNAAKFTPAGGTVRISLRPEGEKRVAIEVADEGIGLETSMLAKIFEPFTQADRSLDHSRGGFGLGLALVKGLVELHDGRVRAASPGPGQGSRFTVELPREARCTRVVEAARAHGQEGQTRRVLLIEDNRDAADTMREALELHDHRVEVAYDGIEGLRKARELRSDVVLCDIGLPGLDGYGVARAIASDSQLAGTWLVAVTGYTQPADRKRALDAGFHRYVPKPASPAVLERVIAEAPA
ncbi:MAG: hybrid sensor histidine kinase/response regulator, partial [Myxococcales bacterium]